MTSQKHYSRVQFTRVQARFFLRLMRASHGKKRRASPRPLTAVSCAARVGPTLGPIEPQLPAPEGRHERVQRGLGGLAAGRHTTG